MTYLKKDLPTSTTLLELCRKKDPSAWDHLNKLYKKLVLYWLKEYNIPSTASDEVYQDILLTLSNQFRSFRKGPTGKFRNWLRKIVFSRAMEYHNNHKGAEKSESLKDGSELKLDPEVVTDEQEKQELTIMNRQLVVFLKDRCNPIHLDAFELILKGMKSLAVAEKTGLSPANVRQITCRLRKLINDVWDGLL